MVEQAAADGASGTTLEALGEALYLEREYAAAAGCYERAYVAYRRERQVIAAGRAARTVAWIVGNVLGDWAVQSGWLGRFRRILAEVGEDSSEHGWALIYESFAEPDALARENLLRDAIAIGRRLGDPDVEFEALVCLGGVFLMTGRAEQGLGMIDEALAAVCAGEVAETATVDSIFCLFFWACELVTDVPRADQWMRRAAKLVQRHNVAGAFCRAHYGGILTAAGRWEEAEVQLVESTRLFDVGMPRAAALIRLADLRLRQGRLEEAAQLLAGLDTHPDAARTLAALHLACGETALARDLLERCTAGSDDAVPRVGETTRLGPLLAVLVDVHLAEGDLDSAERAARRLGRLAEAQRGPYLAAAAALARGRVCVASGQGDARGCLHSALDGFARAQLPMELATTRLELARAMEGLSPEVAVAAAKAALEAFERQGAARHADVAAALLRSLGAPVRTGPKGVGALTKRETEVLQLIGIGLSNVEIGERLFITRKTVEHHVGNTLAKLGLRNRAEAAAYVARHKPAGN
ncbi:regulatory LuxR family protein [Pseudonocardia hierapolitana]|uniref:Regulatory LuxR family protein n=1 Tax=Pseudonocardia hierapolitana TaxID=1128676 RepID=A0A561SZX4_9PSEU|nr:LuxR family transcriptional regulator [Pseudonocardia hierapolitana]TWF80401.1 regulatory LuxR family protein [Pseudonocardia hierapolitana]